MFQNVACICREDIVDEKTLRDMSSILKYVFPPKTTTFSRFAHPSSKLRGKKLFLKSLEIVSLLLFLGSRKWRILQQMLRVYVNGETFRATMFRQQCFSVCGGLQDIVG